MTTRRYYDTDAQRKVTSHVKALVMSNGGELKLDHPLIPRAEEIVLDETQIGDMIIYRAWWVRSPTGQPHPVLPGPTKALPAPGYAFDEDECPGHVASEGNAKICRLCGVHIDSLRPADEEDSAP